MGSRAMMWPDYSNSIANLSASIARAFGAVRTPSQPLPLELPGEGPLLLWIVDGMGADTVARHPDSFFCQAQQGVIHSVFPPTTASAITSFYTAAAPASHAITGWYTWLRELGCVARVLPYQPRFSAEGFPAGGLGPGEVIGAPPVADSIGPDMVVLGPDYLIDSAYSRATAGPARRVGFRSLEMMERLIGKELADGRRRLVVAYWADLDATGHQFGIASDEVEEHFQMLDGAARRLDERCRAAQGTLVVTADHGQIDTDADHTIHLDDHPELAQCLSIPLCGEPRAAFCYVHDAYRQRFERYCRERLGHACEVHRSEDLISAGLFGAEPPHPELIHRCGDYTLLLRENYIIRDRIGTENPFPMIGVHGGLSRAEVEVPLIVVTGSL